MMLARIIICSSFKSVTLMLRYLNPYLAKLVYYILIVRCNCDVTLAQQEIAQIHTDDIIITPIVVAILPVSGTSRMFFAKCI